jgi:hypothetical protein
MLDRELKKNLNDTQTGNVTYKDAYLMNQRHPCTWRGMQPWPSTVGMMYSVCKWSSSSVNLVGRDPRVTGIIE